MERSLKIFMFTEILMDFWLGYFLSIVYFHAISMTDFHISLFHIILGISMFCFDIPSGIFADKTWARNSIILGYFSLSCAFFAYVLAYFLGYWMALFVAAAFFALSDGLRSGASQAYVFTIHRKLGRESEYIAYMSKLWFWTNISTAIAAVLGGYLYQIHPAIPYSLQGMFVLIAAIASLFLIEVHTPPETHISIRGQFTAVISVLRKKITTILLVLLLITSLSTYEIFNNLTNQSYWKESGIPVTYFGYIGLAIFIIRAIFIRLTPWVSKHLRQYAWVSMGVFTLLIGAGFFFSRSIGAVIAISGILSGLSVIIRRISDQSFQEAIHIESVRITFLSFANTVSNIAIRGLFFVASFFLLAHSYREVMYAMSIVFWIATILLGIVYVLAHTKTSSDFEGS